MNDRDSQELARLRKRFPHIQEIHSDSMDNTLYAGILVSAAGWFFYHCYPLASASDVLQLAGGLICLCAGAAILGHALEEAGAIARYLELLDAERLSR